MALLALLLGSPPSNAEWEQPRLGHTLSALPESIVAPAFSLADMDGSHHALADYKGKVILLNFWATWCPPCRREMPSMERLYQQLGGDYFTVIAINQMEDPDHVFAYTGQLEIDPTFTMLFDPDSTISRAYAVNGLPTTYVIDKTGLIRYRAIGGREFDHPEVSELLKKLMTE